MFSRSFSGNGLNSTLAAIFLVALANCTSHEPNYFSDGSGGNAISQAGNGGSANVGGISEGSGASLGLAGSPDPETGGKAAMDPPGDAGAGIDAGGTSGSPDSPSGGTVAMGGTLAAGGGLARGTAGGTTATGGTQAAGGPTNGGSVSGGGTAGAVAQSGGTSAAGTAGAGSCTTAPAAGPLLGWASQNDGTTGGGDAAPIIVTTKEAFNSAISGKSAKVIYVQGSFNGVFSIGSNKTIVGLCGAVLQGHVSLSKASNVIVRNLTIVGNNCSDSPQDCSNGADAVTIGDSSQNVWFDHCDVYDGSDGNMDITSGADFITISWTKFHYSTARSDPKNGASGNRFSNLIGSDDDAPEDVGHLNVTFHHDWWADNVNARMPRTRHGKIHLFNNLFTAAGDSYCTNAGFQASLLVENNVYDGVALPLQIEAGSNLLATGNAFNSTTGNTIGSGVGFKPPYLYTLDSTTDLEATLMSQVGPQ